MVSFGSSGFVTHKEEMNQIHPHLSWREGSKAQSWKGINHRMLDEMGSKFMAMGSFEPYSIPYYACKLINCKPQLALYTGGLSFSIVCVCVCGGGGGGGGGVCVGGHSPPRTINK